MNRCKTGFGLLSALVLTMGAPAAMSSPLSTAPEYSSLPAETEIAPANAAATLALPAVEETAAPSICVYAFSKNICDSRLIGGLVEETFCGDNCHTITVRDATWVMPMRSNREACSGIIDPQLGRCDEVPEKDGQLKANVNYLIRYNDPCKFRGCITSTYAEYQAADGTVYIGTLNGTIGVGTHRRITCPLYERQRDCEKCLDVEFFFPPVAPSGVWRFGVELTFHGRRADGVVGDELCFSLSGDLFANGTASGPFEFINWRFAGAADGVHTAPCIP